MRTKHLFFLMLLSALIIIIFTQSTLAMGVKPLVVDLNMKPGETKEFELLLTSSGKEEVVDLSFYQPVQLLNGDLTYQKVDSEVFAAQEWLKLENEKVKLSPGTKDKIRGEVTVPFGAGGSHTVVLMVEPESEQKKQGVSFRVRYAVKINIRIERPGLRPQAELENWELIKGEEKEEPIIRAEIANSSTWDYFVTGEATIRDSNRKLVERITLQSPAGARRDSNQIRMYPGSTVEYLGEVTRKLEPGEYNLSLFIRYGDHGQIIKNKQIIINKGDFKFPRVKEISAFSIEPNSIDLELNPGQRKSKLIKLNSEISNNVRIMITGKEIRSDYQNSLLEWLRIRNEKEFQLSGRQGGRIILTVVTPREVKDGSYHGNLVVKAHSLEDNKLVEQKEIPISVLIGDKYQIEVQMKSLHYSPEEAGYLFSLDLYNKSNVMIQPEATLVIKDEKGQFIRQITLGLPEEEKKIIPFQSQRLTGVVKGLSPGIYQTEIEVRNKNKKIDNFEKTLEIKE